MLEGILWGLKSVAWFDVWSIKHILSGVSSGGSVKKHHEKKFKKHQPPRYQLAPGYSRRFIFGLCLRNNRALFRNWFSGSSGSKLVSWGRVLGKPNYNRSTFDAGWIFNSQVLPKGSLTRKNYLICLVIHSYIHISALYVST